MSKFTDKTVQAQKPRDKQYKVSVGDGLYLVVNPTGTKWWRFDYRFGGKQKTISIGVYGKAPDGVTLEAATDAAIDNRRLVKAGIDPSDKRKADKAADSPAAPVEPQPKITFGKIADDWLKTREGGGKKTYARDARMVGYLKDGKGPAAGFGKVEIDQVELSHLSPILKVVNHPTRIRLISAARKIVSYAKVHGGWPKDRASPFADVDFSDGFAPHKEKHRPAITDPVAFGHLLRKIEVYEGREDNLTGYALKLLALTFVRPGTVQNAEWAHFNLEKAVWVVPFECLKMATERAEAGKSEDDYVIPLSRQAVALLRELRKITGDGEYLFPGRGSRTISENTLNYALHGLGYKDVHCAHGFRSSASTMLNRERIMVEEVDADGAKRLVRRRRFEESLIEMQQDRLDAETRAIYNRDDRLTEREELMQFWADRLDAMRRQPDGGASNVVDIIKVA